jgi:hypothetical protein
LEKTSQLTVEDFVQSHADPPLWILHGEHGASLVMIYADDGLMAACTAAGTDALVDLVASMHAIRALEEPQNVLGIEVSRDRDVGICQQRKDRVTCGCVCGVFEQPTGLAVPRNA